MNSSTQNINLWVLKKKANGYACEQREVKQSRELIADLTAMNNNPNRTVLDLQNRFTAHFGPRPTVGYSCCLPFHYASSFIYGACLPKMKNINEYNKEKSELKGQGIESWNKRLKDSFYADAIRYIQAADLHSATKNAKEDDSVKMCSHENIGWTSMKHVISDDLVITINTNFGFGYSSYFLLNVTYKGIDLLPYSHLVNYYYAGVAEIKNHTRSYCSDRENWGLAMDFAADVSTKTEDGDLSFARNWLKHEIDEMISRLYAINENPSWAMKDIDKRSKNANRLVAVRMTTERDKNLLKLYPNEMPIAFKAFKLTSALELIDKLQVAGEIYEPALVAIDKIKEINRLFAPELSEWISKIARTIEQLEAETIPYKKQLEPIKEKIEIHNNEISALYEAREDKNKLKYQIAEEYHKSHPELVKLEENRDILVNKINEINSRIGDYNHFKSSMEECYKLIDENILALCA